MRIFKSWLNGRMHEYVFGHKNNIRRFDTNCCALGQLSLNNRHTVEEIKQAVESIKDETKYNWSIMNRDGGERAIFVIVTMPYEEELALNLAKAGFEWKFDFNRRNGYPAGFNQFWVIKW